MEIKHRSDLGELVLSIFGTYGHAIEVGVAEGLFSLDLLKMGFEKLYMCDNWNHIPHQLGDGGYDDKWHERNFKAAIERVYQYRNRIQILRGISWKMAEYIYNDSLSLVYVDCDHSFNSVMKDIKAYWPKLKSGGVMAFHDYWYLLPYGVNKAVNEYATEHDLQIHEISENKPEDSGCWFQKK